MCLFMAQMQYVVKVGRMFCRVVTPVLQIDYVFSQHVTADLCQIHYYQVTAPTFSATTENQGQETSILSKCTYSELI